MGEIMLKKIYAKIFKYTDIATRKRLLRQNLKKPEELHEDIDIKYGEDDINRFDIIYPSSQNDQKLTTILYIHGGGYVAGLKENCMLHCYRLAQMGYCVINMEYTKSETKGFPTPVFEAFQLLNYIQIHKEIARHIDFDKLFLCGDSAGGHISALAANILESEDLKQKFGVQSDLKIKGLILHSPVFGVFKFGKLRFLRKRLEEVVFNEYNSQSIKNCCNNLELLNKNFPPCIIFTANNDILNVHTNILLKKAKKLNLSIMNYNFITGKNLFHDFTITYPDGKEAKFARQKTKLFIEKVSQNTLSNKCEKKNISLVMSKITDKTQTKKIDEEKTITC